MTEDGKVRERNIEGFPFSLIQDLAFKYGRDRRLRTYQTGQPGSKEYLSFVDEITGRILKLVEKKDSRFNGAGIIETARATQLAGLVLRHAIKNNWDRNGEPDKPKGDGPGREINARYFSLPYSNEVDNREALIDCLARIIKTIQQENKYSYQGSPMKDVVRDRTTYMNYISAYLLRLRNNNYEVVKNLTRNLDDEIAIVSAAIDLALEK
ncbi:MAG: hypothetical protein ABID45_00565 [Patescibacteria group bacterium]